MVVVVVAVVVLVVVVLVVVVVVSSWVCDEQKDSIFPIDTVIYALHPSCPPFL